ncbi:MAG: sigma-54-dependent Fis family transcriptional regulator [Deltaproteobacteria bacterium]|nr:sigma-54-dependent Fis family transcriptional regulator [Deltaproteobacteria bacterium]
MSEKLRKILIADDDRDLRMSLYEALNRQGYAVSVAENGIMALDLLEKNPADLVIADINMPEMGGLDLLRAIHAVRPELPVVIITGHATVETAVSAMKLGAYDYLLKPFSVDVILQTAARAFTAVALPRDESAVPVREKNDSSLKKPIIGSDTKLARVLQKAKSVASSKATVLILGESGTGKEMIARYIHEESTRKDGPFVALNCAALPEGLLESELFGHEKGAFTGAIYSKKGKFELADCGTLLLDEIAEIPLHLQAKLLRVLQEEEVDRLGGKYPVKVDVHVVATTNRNLEESVKKGEFRQDLYYRLNVIPLTLPPLRERGSDIERLAESFIQRYSQQYGKEIKKMSKASRSRFCQYGWPGNIREMENLVERAVLLSLSAELEPWDFWDEETDGAGIGVVSPCGAEPDSLPVFAGEERNGEMASLRDVERQMIMQALQKTDNNRTHAARMLGISVRTLRNKLHEYRSQGVLG